MPSTAERVHFDTRPRSRADRLFLRSAAFASLLSTSVVFFILIFMTRASWGTFAEQGTGFITGSTWDSTSNPPSFQILPMLYGSLLVALIGLVIAVPCAIAVAYLIEFMVRGRLRGVASLVVDLLAAIPSVIIGIWGALVFSPVAAGWSTLITKHLGVVPVLSNSQPNALRSPFIAGWIVAIMILPIITSVSREVMSRVDKDLIAAAVALGATSSSVARRVVLPTAKSGIMGGVLLGLGRALGETVAIFFVLNLVFDTNWYHVLEPQGGAIASMIIAKFGEATGAELNALMAAGVVLFVVTLVVNMFATWIVERAERRMAS